MLGRLQPRFALQSERESEREGGRERERGRVLDRETASNPGSANLM